MRALVLVTAAFILGVIIACEGPPGEGSLPASMRPPPEYWLVWVADTWDTSTDILALPNTKYDGDGYCGESAGEVHPMPTYPPYISDPDSDRPPIPVCVHRETYLMMTDPDWRSLITPHSPK